MPSGTIALLAADLELERFLRPEDQSLAAQVTLPLRELPAGPLAPGSLLDAPGTFAALLLDGILLQTVRLADHTGLRLIGPGDLVSLRPPVGSGLISATELRATVPTRLALIGDGFLLAARRMPPLMAALQDRSADQSDRMLTQMMICQLPRVDDRLLAILWLVAETWGRVTPSGTLVPVRLTHGLLGGLVGARRSTVTLALKQLTNRGALLRQADGWLLLEQPQGASRRIADAPTAAPRPLLSPTVTWSATAPERHGPQPRSELSEELRRTVTRLRAEHAESARLLQLRLRSLSQSRETLALSRRRISLERQSRSPVPSS